MRRAQSLVAATLDVEIGLHIEYCRGWGLSEAAMDAEPEALETIAYTRFVLDRGLAGDRLDLEVALAPCIVGYAEIARERMADPATRRDGNPYREWLEMYAGAEYQELARGAAAALDEQFARRGGEGRFPALAATFATAARLEADFWQMGLSAGTAERCTIAPTSICPATRPATASSSRCRAASIRRSPRPLLARAGSKSSASRCSFTTTAPRPGARAPAAPGRTSTTRRASPSGSASRITCSITRARFRAAVIEDFAESYRRGETPVPCIRCNQRIKFRDLLATARDLGADALATGHYVAPGARAGRAGTAPRARRGARPELFPLSHDARRARFPALSARAVSPRTRPGRWRANSACRSRTSPTARTSALCRRAPTPISSSGCGPKPASPATSSIAAGRVLGRHAGIAHFTVGQRKGLGIAAAEPLYVLRLDPETRRVIVGPREALGQTRIRSGRDQLARQPPLAGGRNARRGQTALGAAAGRRQHC